jgi:hypothetical protein
VKISEYSSSSDVFTDVHYMHRKTHPLCSKIRKSNAVTMNLCECFDANPSYIQKTEYKDPT